MDHRCSLLRQRLYHGKAHSTIMGESLVRYQCIRWLECVMYHQVVRQRRDTCKHHNHLRIMTVYLQYIIRYRFHPLRGPASRIGPRQGTPLHHTAAIRRLTAVLMCTTTGMCLHCQENMIRNNHTQDIDPRQLHPYLCQTNGTMPIVMLISTREWKVLVHSTPPGRLNESRDQVLTKLRGYHE